MNSPHATAVHKHAAIAIPAPRRSASPDPFALSLETCLRLLKSKHVGRVVYTNQAIPAVTPVNYAFDCDTVVLRGAQGFLLEAKLPGAVVAFEVDDLDDGGCEGWSVLVIGLCALVTDGPRLEAVEKLPLNPWTSGEKPIVLEIDTQMVSGRRFLPGVDHTPRATWRDPAARTHLR
jgi:uncharacterized protein